jgi:formylglycine-generating enzyme required for sulfatase activity
MRRTFLSLALLCALGFFRPGTAMATITFATVPVGNLVNANDSTGYGGVAYSYSIGQYDVTVGQYTAFLNAVAATDTYSLYNPSMATDLNVAGIQQNGSSGSYAYSVIGSANHPITYVSWFDAARFANWLYNGQPNGAEGTNTTETGSYTLNGSNPFNVSRNTNATWVIPTENEWYKAAYYNPSNNTYYQYPFSSSTVPTSAMPGSTPNTGNFHSGTTGYAVTGSIFYSSSQNYLTDVGAYTNSASPYGAYDMGGDVFQWNETLISSSFRGRLGGSWDDVSNALASSPGYDNVPTLESNNIGFRVAIVPEPASFILLGLASLGLLWRTRR